MITPPRLPRGLYRTPDPVHSDDYTGKACVEYFGEKIFIEYLEYFNCSFKPYFTQLPTKDEYENYIKGSVNSTTRREYEALVEEAIAAVEAARNAMEERPEFLNKLREMDYDDYLNALGVDVYNNRFRLRVYELDKLVRYLNPCWPYKEYPILEEGQTEFIIPACEACRLEIENLYIPDGVTLKPAPGVKAIEWSVRNIRFGENATIDLSAPNWEPPAPRLIPGSLHSAVGENGKRGIPGLPGINGADGVSLKLKGIMQIEGTGTLWIRTDGGPGGVGGQGGMGQEVIPQRRFFSWHGTGGDGGMGGAGGNGGSTSAINLSFRTESNPFDLGAGLAQDCAPSVRPTYGTKGSIIIYGARGSSGKGGIGGLPGSGRHSGSTGQIGATGLQGGAGSFICRQYLGDV